MEHLEAAISGSDDEMMFADEKPKVLEKKKKDNKAGGVQYERGQTMYINGKPIRIDKSKQALNKREKSNWLVHLLFIRQDYNECMKYVD